MTQVYICVNVCLSEINSQLLKLIRINCYAPERWIAFTEHLKEQDEASVWNYFLIDKIEYWNKMYRGIHNRWP